jgi:putative transposase
MDLHRCSSDATVITRSLALRAEAAMEAGPERASAELIAAIVEMKRRNPRFGCRRIAQQIAFVFGVEIDKDVVRRVLTKHCRPTSGSHGPSWLSFLGHAKDSLWSVDLFRCESLIIKTHWVMVVMDQFTRRIIGFAVQSGAVDGASVCRMFNQIVAGAPALPQHLSSDHDPLFNFIAGRPICASLDVSEIKTVPHVPLSHPFVERLIGTVRRELLDQIPFWGASDLERKLLQFSDYYNEDRVHASLDGRPPICKTAATRRSAIDLSDYQWRSHCRGLYRLPAAA